MLQPPKNVTKNQIPPREYIFIVDVSGSMHGYPLDISKQLFKDLIGNLRSTDRFNVLLFAGGSHLMSEQSLVATPQNIQRAINTIARQRGGGGTRFLLALKRALSLPKTEGYSRSIVIATDGYVSVEEEAFDLIRNNLGNANMFAFGIGSSVNRHVIEGMARVGMGEPFVITQRYEAPKMAKRFRKMIESPVLTNIKVDFEGFEVYDVEPPSIPDVFADRPVIVFGKWLGRPQGSISLRGITGERSFSRRVDVSRIEPLSTNSALRYLWARHRITILSDYNKLKRHDERAREVTNLGLTYNLLTAYTSFVAVDTRIRLQDGKAVTVKQPLPLPQGVSDYAVGRRSGARHAAKSFSTAPSGRVQMQMELSKQIEVPESKQLDLKAPAQEKRASIREGDEIELGEILVTGGLSKKSIHRLLKRHLTDFNLCYRQTLKNGLSIKGKVVFKVVIDATGRVSKVTPDNGHKYVGFEKCMAQEFKRLRFPTPQGAKPVVILVALTFK
jgi:Ca-activated chloride channel family protein